MLTWLWLR